MAAIFSNLGLSTESIEKFFMNMIFSDMSMPHTKTKLSPITFSEFMARNQILAINQFDIYVEANKIWKRIYEDNPRIFDASHRPKYNLDLADQHAEGSWCVLIDYMNRLRRVEEMASSPYYQMHYVAHVCNNFYRETDKEEYPEERRAALRSIFNQTISPILYECIVPTQYIWLPIENFLDMRFQNDLENMVARLTNYVTNHSGQVVNAKELNKTRIQQLKSEIDGTMTAVYKTKYEDAWKPTVTQFFARCSMYRIDLEMFELYTAMLNGDLSCIMLLKKLDKVRVKFEKNLYDADDFIDALLDIRSWITSLKILDEKKVEEQQK